jgi:hypothetical protein
MDVVRIPILALSHNELQYPNSSNAISALIPSQIIIITLLFSNRMGVGTLSIVLD